MRTDDDRQELLDEVDLALVHALQIDARAPWTKIATVIGVDAATVARHWQSLRARSLAWLTIWPTTQRWASSTDVAVVLIGAQAEASALEEVTARPWVLGVEETSAGYLALVAASGGLATLGERVRDLVAEGIRLQRMDVASSFVTEDSAWRLRALSPAQQRRLRVEPSQARAPRSDVIAELAAALEEDPRLPSAVLATRLGVSEATARRVVERATATGLLRFGCDMAMAAAGFRRGAILWARSPDVEGAAMRAGRLPEIHRVATLVGPSPLFAAARANSLTALPAIEDAWGADVEVTDRWTVLRTLKRNGHLLDDAGRSVSRVTPRW